MIVRHKDAIARSNSSGEEMMDRRKFLKRVGVASLGSVAAGAVVYPFLEAKWCRIVPQTIILPNLPMLFAVHASRYWQTYIMGRLFR